MNNITIQSPAKLNLHLKVLRKRPDGYHDLLTLFHRISLSDTITIQKRKKGFRLSTNRRGLETGEGSLITKAYRSLQKKFPELGGVSVRLEKKIPLGAGLGGGSSNAAHFLLGMKKLFRLRISRKELFKIGKTLGADVPFFLMDTSNAVAWGIGDKMRSLLLLVTDKGLKTKKVYQNLRVRKKPVSLTKEKRVAIILSSFFGTKRIREAAGLAENDLESSAFVLRPSISRAVKALRSAGASFALMSGSGPTVFAVLENREKAEALRRRSQARSLPYRKLICHTF